MEQNRGQWGSNFGFLMAAIGSAVGLGNIWGFPYKMGANGGFAFLLVYLTLAAVVGFSIMISELAIGRKVGRNVLMSYREVGGGLGVFIGWLAIISPFLILTFYTVLGAYCIQYMVLNFTELIAGGAVQSGADSFVAMLTNAPMAIFYTFIFIFVCFLIIRGGIKDGIERFNAIGMPALFIMLVIVIMRSVTLPGAVEGLKFMFAPNLTPFKEDFIGVLSAAGGQMFFSLSLAMGITVTYGSYLSKKESLVRNSWIVIVSDTVVALLAGVAVLPAAFALGGEDAAMAGPKLLFITLQDVFAAMGRLGSFFGVLFYLLVIIAAITSAIALMEVLATLLIDNAAAKNKSVSRGKVVTLVSLAIMAGATLVAADGLGANGLWVPLQGSGLALSGSWLDFVDFFSEGVFMPLGALLMSIMVGWVIGPKIVRDEVTQNGVRFGGGTYAFFKVCIRFLAPAGMLFILVGMVISFL